MYIYHSFQTWNRLCTFVIRQNHLKNVSIMYVSAKHTEHYVALNVCMCEKFIGETTVELLHITNAKIYT